MVPYLYGMINYLRKVDTKSIIRLKLLFFINMLLKALPIIKTAETDYQVCLRRQFFRNKVQNKVQREILDMKKARKQRVYELFSWCGKRDLNIISRSS